MYMNAIEYVHFAILLHTTHTTTKHLFSIETLDIRYWFQMENSISLLQIDIVFDRIFPYSSSYSISNNT